MLHCFRRRLHRELFRLETSARSGALHPCGIAPGDPDWMRFPPRRQISRTWLHLEVTATEVHDMQIRPDSMAPTSLPVDSVAEAIRRAKLLFLIAAGVSFLFSVSLWFAGKREEGVFVGLWVPSILALGSLMLSGRGRQS